MPRKIVTAAVVCAQAIVGATLMFAFFYEILSHPEEPLSPAHRQALFTALWTNYSSLYPGDGVMGRESGEAALRHLRTTDDVFVWGGASTTLSYSPFVRSLSVVTTSADAHRRMSSLMAERGLKNVKVYHAPPEEPQTAKAERRSANTPAPMRHFTAYKNAIGAPARKFDTIIIDTDAVVPQCAATALDFFKRDGRLLVADMKPAHHREVLRWYIATETAGDLTVFKRKSATQIKNSAITPLPDWW